MSVCPATMCPLFAAEGSPWTGDRSATCPQRHGMRGKDVCAWWSPEGGCNGARAATEQALASAAGESVLQIGPVQARRAPAAPRTYDCPHAATCQWQLQAGQALCPPRLALAAGIDPRICAW